MAAYAGEMSGVKELEPAGTLPPGVRGAQRGELLLSIDELALAAPWASGACGVARSAPLPTVNDSFCGAAYDATTEAVYALVETHDISQFPDPDCQNLSGTVSKVKVVKMTEAGGYEELADVPGGGPLSGSPAMLRGDAWLHDAARARCGE